MRLSIKHVKKLALRAMLAAIALVLSFVEAQLPVFFAVPGMKLGLTNVVVLMALYVLSPVDALVINCFRILFVGLTFGNAFSMLYAFSGGLLSFLVMWIAKRSRRLKTVTVSILGGVFHNIGQVIVAMCVLNSGYVLYYLPFLWISGIAAGAAVGVLGALVIRYLPKKLLGMYRHSETTELSITLLSIAFLGLSLTQTACTPVIQSYQKDIFAMDTYMTLTAYGDEAEEAVNDAIDEIRRLEAMWDTGDPESEISRLNTTGKADLTETIFSDSAASDEASENGFSDSAASDRASGNGFSAESAALLKRAMELSDLTGGAFNVSVFPLMEAWGFTSGSYRVPSEAEISACLLLLDPQNIELSEELKTISLKDGAEIDFGGIAKGYTSSRIMEIFEEHHLQGGIVSLGGNVQTYGKKADGKDFRVAIENPVKEGMTDEAGNTAASDKTGNAAVPNGMDMAGNNAAVLRNPLYGLPYVGVLTVSDKALITSGGYQRYFEEGGVTYHHILDPKTGAPAKSGLLSATIISDDGTLADALSTALFVMGKEQAIEFWRAHSDLFECILIDETGMIYVTEGLEKSYEPDGGNNRKVQYEIIKK